MLKTIHDIDFATLYKQHKQLAARPRSSPEKWDAKAQQIGIGQLEDAYTHALLQALSLQKTETLLDVGCGAGAVALLAAPYVRQVYALDYSVGMLAKLQENAQHYQAHNIKTLCKDWEDDWQDVPVCDVVVASRSTLVEDMAAALKKLTQQARRRVYLTYPLNPAFGARPDIDPVQQPQLATPSYLYILGILYQQGYAAQLRFIGNKGLHQQPTGWALIDWEV